MFYEVQIYDVVRVPPNEITDNVKEMIEKILLNNYNVL